ncbi:MAG TPA: EAL domain-containing protein [Burkholderiaceae bacterium]|nr:EAL domain-containing protein [Burkholderiaceae bacterium]
MSKNSILIVDDDTTSLARLQQILGDDYTLTFARNGTECLEDVKKHHPDLILMDIEMPGLNGYTLCHLIKSDPLTEDTPVIFISALNEIGDETAGFRSGGVDYIIKPVSPSIVKARVATHLSLVRATMLERYVKQLEIEKEKTARLTRILAVMSDTNSAIVRIRAPQELTEEACRIAVDHGGFGVAWIGLASDSVALSLAACQGIDPGQLIELLLAAADKSAIRSTIQDHVLMTREAIVCNDVRTTLEYALTCRDAETRGYRSIIGLPFFNNEKIIGVMVLYAREADYFDDEEIKLLKELAGDISFALQAIESEKRANFLAYNDGLTSLPNTALFLDRLGQLIQVAERAAESVFVVLLNLDRFKQLNDAMGRHVGDQVLRTLAKRLVDEFSQHCTIARVSADNFGLAGILTNGVEVRVFCEQIVKVLDAPFNVDGKNLDVLARLGVSMYPADASSAESLFKNAEVSLKQTKSLKVRYSFYSPEFSARIAEKMEMENMLKSALEKEQFVLHYQPKVDLRTGEIMGAEALIRWQHPERGMILPTEFIPLAEETGLILPIGEWVIRTVCEQQAAWRRDGVPVFPVALNLSALQFRDGNLLNVLSKALSDHDIVPSAVELELTESLMMQNPEAAGEAMRAFRKLGFKLSLDDFGTGYSSLAHLKQFPFHTVKIDRAFVTGITQNPEDAAIASAVIGMAHSLSMNVIAEGVETEAQMKFLRARHCDQMQGYFFSLAVPAEDFGSMLRDGKLLELEHDPETEQHALLIVDDDKDILSSLNLCLRGQGYRILQASDGPEALELLAKNTVQVIICGQCISTSSSVDFLATAAKLYPESMRIILSAYTELGSVLDAVNRGDIYRFLTKPWDDEQLRDSIRDAFRRYRPAI